MYQGEAHSFSVKSTSLGTSSPPSRGRRSEHPPPARLFAGAAANAPWTVNWPPPNGATLVRVLVPAERLRAVELAPAVLPARQQRLDEPGQRLRDVRARLLPGGRPT
jgi:hypothetical protein